MNPTEPQLDEVENMLKEFIHVMCADKYRFSRTWEEYLCFAGQRIDDSHTRIVDLDPRIWRGDFQNKDLRVDGQQSWNEMIGDYFDRLELRGGDAWGMIDYMATTHPTNDGSGPKDLFCIACAVGRPESELAAASQLKARPESISRNGITRGVRPYRRNAVVVYDR